MVVIKRFVLIRNTIAPDTDWWDRLPACLLGMTGNPAFRTGVVTFENCLNLIIVNITYHLWLVHDSKKN